MKTTMRSIAALFFCLLIGVLIGCGGLGSSAALAKARVTVEWPQLTMAVSAPTYAGSASITILSSVNSKSIHWFVDRPAGTGSQTVNYVGPSSIPTGPGQLRVEFYAGGGGSGEIVATAAASIIIDQDGDLLNSAGGTLGTVGFDSNLTGISLYVLDAHIGEAARVFVSGLNTSGLTALPQGLVSLEITQNSQNATLSEKMLTGVAEGPVGLSATFESFSFETIVYIQPRQETVKLYQEFVPNRIAWDSLHSKIWGTFGSGPLYANTIVDIDPITGEIGIPISVGSEPDAISISADGTTAYVGLNGSSELRKIDLVNRVAGPVTQLQFQNDPVRVTGLDINPTNSDEVAVCVQNISSSGFGGPFIYREGVQIGADPGVYSSSSIYYTSGTSLIGVQDGISSGNIYRISVTSNSVDIVQTVSTGNYAAGQNSLAGSKLVTSSGYTYDTSNLAQIGRVAFSQENLMFVNADSTHDFAWGIFANGPYQSPNYRIRAIDLSTFEPIESSSIEFSNSYYLMRFGSTGLAFYGPSGLTVIADAPGL